MIRQIEEPKIALCTMAARAHENGHNVIPPTGAFFYE